MTVFIMILLSSISTEGYQTSIQLGPQVRFVFPYTEALPSVSNADQLEDIFFAGDAEIFVGGKVTVGLIPGFPMELSGSYASYEPEVKYDSSFPDSVNILFREGHLVLASAGLSRKLGEVRLLAGADIFFYRETWSEEDESSYGGYHREYSRTIAGPYIGAAKDFRVSVMDMAFDIRLHLPDLSERWVSSGISILFH